MPTSKLRKSSSDWMVVAELAEQLQLDRSHLHRKIKHEQVPTIKVPRETNGGVQNLIAVRREWANKLIERYEQARRPEL